MHLKPITALAVLSLVIASLLVSGCTSKTSTSRGSGSEQASISNPTANTAATDLKFISSYVRDKLGYNITTSFVEFKSPRGNTAYTGTAQNANGTMMTITFEKVSSEKDAQTAVTQNILNATAKGLSPLAATGVGKDTMEFKTYNNTWTGAKFNGFISAEFLDVGYKKVSLLGWYVLSISGMSFVKSA